MKDYKTPAEQRAKMTAYYYKNRERILEYQRQQREKELQNKSKRYSNLIEMYQDWNLYIEQRLQSQKRLSKWIRRSMELQYLRNEETINRLKNQK